MSRLGYRVYVGESAASIFSMTNGLPVNNDSVSDERSTCPPPSPREPLMVSVSAAT